jgi:hypothetical protein
VLTSRSWIIDVWIVFFALTNWPVLVWANRTDPWIGPFPFLVIWMIGFSLITGVLHMVFGLRYMKDPPIPERTEVTEAGQPVAEDEEVAP